MPASDTAAKKTAKKAPAKKTVAKTAASGNGVVIGDKPPTAPPTTPLRRPSTTEHQMPEGQIVIQRIATETVRIPIRGLTPLITHKFSEKAKRQMLDAMQGRKNPKEAKNPEREYEDAKYKLDRITVDEAETMGVKITDDDRLGIPAIAFKSATVSAARFFGKSVTMVGLRQTLFVAGEFSRREGMMLCQIIGEPEMREDVVRVGNGGTDLRYRPCWTEWETFLDVTFVKSMLTRDSVLSLVEAGGLGVGVGEWRPERRGEYGTYAIDTDKQIEVLKI